MKSLLAKPLPQTPIQRRYYWAIVTHAARCCLPDGAPAETQKHLHRELKGQLLGWEEIVGADGRPTLEPISTTDLSHDEFSQYIEAVLAVLVDSDVPFPDNPEELLTICPRRLPEPLPSAKRKVAP